MNGLSFLSQYSFFNNLQKLKFVEKIILYGSRARQDAQERSDIDIAISCPNATENDWQQIVDIIENADTLLKIDCVWLEKLYSENPLKQAIMKEGIVIYRKMNE